MINFVDLEACSLEGGHPTEVAVVRADRSNRSWLIRPDEGWLDRRLWSAEAESLHGLAQDFLIEHGLPAAQVAAEVAGLLADQVVYSDAPAHDGRWLGVMHAGKIQNSVHFAVGGAGIRFGLPPHAGGVDRPEGARDGFGHRDASYRESQASGGAASTDPASRPARRGQPLAHLDAGRAIRGRLGR